MISKDIKAQINDIVYYSVLYGGDAGGPCCSDEESSKEVLYNWISYMNLKDDCFVVGSGLNIKISLKE